MKNSRTVFTACWNISDMDRVNRIYNHPLWQSSLREIEELERDRIFCRHDTEHFFDVARLAYIENLEKGLGFPKENIYAAALLHDIGRHLEYKEGISHEEGSAMLAETILSDCGFDDEEQREITRTILSHRKEETGLTDDLSGLIFRADKKSRMCMLCSVQSECKWSEEKKNLEITV